MRRRILAVFGVFVMTQIGLAPAATADKPTEPAQSGIVARFETQGGHSIEPKPIDIDGTVRPMFTVVGWDSAVGFCTGGPPVPNGVQQDVISPSGNFSAVVHNGDIPVMIFDVSGIESEEEFELLCAEGAVQPFATGTLKQRPIITSNKKSFTVKVASHGTVQSADGRDWQVNAFLKLTFGAGPDPTSGMSSLQMKAR